MKTLDKNTEEQQPKMPRAEYRRMMRDKLYQHKMVAAMPNVSEYYRLLAYGQVLIHKMDEVKMRMMGVPYARGRRPIGQRDTLSLSLTEEWNDCVEKIEGVQEQMAKHEAEQKKKEEATKEKDV